nr:hypothetical protein [Chlamydiales bacterium]
LTWDHIFSSDQVQQSIVYLMLRGTPADGLLARLQNNNVEIKASSKANPLSGNIFLHIDESDLEKFQITGKAYDEKTLHFAAGRNLELFDPIIFKNTSANLILEGGTLLDQLSQVHVMNQITFEKNTTGNLIICSGNREEKAFISDAVSAGSIRLDAMLDFHSSGKCSISSAKDIHIGKQIQSSVENITSLYARENIYVDGSILNHLNGDIEICAENSIHLGSLNKNSSHQIGSAMGNVLLQAGKNIFLQGGEVENSFSQIGYFSKETTNALGNISIKLDGTLSLKAGENINTYVLVGNGGGNGKLNPSGSISISSLSNKIFDESLISLQAGQNLNAFAQIGHIRRNHQHLMPIIGDISIAEYFGDIEIIGGSGENAYALIGHLAYSGLKEDLIDGNIQITLDPFSNGSILLKAGSSISQTSFAGIGHVAIHEGNQKLSVISNQFSLEASHDIIVESNHHNEAFVGGRIFSDSVEDLCTMQIGFENQQKAFLRTFEKGNLILKASDKEGFHGAIIGPVMGNDLSNFSMQENEKIAVQKLFVDIDGSILIKSGSQRGIAYLGTGKSPLDLQINAKDRIEIDSINGISKIYSQGSLDIHSSIIDIKRDHVINQNDPVLFAGRSLEISADRLNSRGFQLPVEMVCNGKIHFSIREEAILQNVSVMSNKKVAPIEIEVFNGPLFILNGSSIYNEEGDISILSKKMILQGDEEHLSSVHSQNGIIDLAVLKDLICESAIIQMKGDFAYLNSSIQAGSLTMLQNTSIQNRSGNDFHIETVEDIMLWSGRNGASIKSLGNMVIESGGNITVEGIKSSASIQSEGSLMMMTNQSFLLKGSSESAQGMITAVDGNIIVKADQDIRIDDFGMIYLKEGQTIDLVADQKHLENPSIGSGRFYLLPDGKIYATSNRNIRIFSAKYDQNILLGTINDQRASSSDFYHEYGIWYDSYKEDLNQGTFFYKEEDPFAFNSNFSLDFQRSSLVDTEQIALRYWNQRLWVKSFYTKSYLEQEIVDNFFWYNQDFENLVR